MMLFLLIALFSCVAAANVGAIPEYPHVVLNASYNGGDLPDDTMVEARCFVNGREDTNIAASFGCIGNLCKNFNWNRLSNCAGAENATAIFKFENSAFLNPISTGQLVIAKGKTYVYRVWLNSSAADASLVSVTDETRSACAAGFALPLLALLAFAAKGVRN